LEVQSETRIVLFDQHTRSFLDGLSSNATLKSVE
jgi:hypothetical protein